MYRVMGILRNQHKPHCIRTVTNKTEAEALAFCLSVDGDGDVRAWVEIESDDRSELENEVQQQSESDLCDAATTLAVSTRGRNAMIAILRWLDDDGLSLDAANQAAVLTILSGAWGSFGSTARDVMRHAIERWGEYAEAD